MNQTYKEARARLEPFGSRSYIIREISEYATYKFEPSSLDFIYLDASHRFSGVALDLIRWWPLLREGGVFAGHDYWTHYRCEVMAAVNGFVVEQEQYFHVTTGEGSRRVYPPSWWLVKQKRTKAEYFAGLEENKRELQAAKATLAEKGVTISLPYEYEEGAVCVDS